MDEDFQLLDALGELVYRLALRVGQLGVLQGLVVVRAVANDAAGDADHRRVRWHRFQHHRAGADADVVCYQDVAEDLRATADDDPIAQCGMTFAGFLAGTAESDALVEQAIVADDRGFPDDHTHAVIDEEAAADAGSGMDLDARQPAGALA